jgi:hypothetical protein
LVFYSFLSVASKPFLDSDWDNEKLQWAHQLWKSSFPGLRVLELCFDPENVGGSWSNVTPENEETGEAMIIEGLWCWSFDFQVIINSEDVHFLQDKKTPVKFFDPDVERARRFEGFSS